MLLLIGGYTADTGGSASGIATLAAGDPDAPVADGQLRVLDETVPADSPSWVSVDASREVAYAALEGRGQVRAFRRTGETSWEPWGDAVDVGQSPCHVLVAPTGDRLVVSCWSDGQIFQVALDAEGRPGRADAVPAASDPYPSFGQDPRPSRAHQAIALSRTAIATTDMGLDIVRLWRVSVSGLAFEQEVVLPQGAGPRHAVWHPSGHLYVLTELSCEVFVLAPDPRGRWHVVGGVQIGAGTLPGDTAAELALSADREFLYAGVRGSNTLGVLRVLGGGEQLAPVALLEAGVDNPRHHLVVRDTLLVAGRRSDDIVSMTIDTRTGVPGRIRHRVTAGSPTCLAALP